MARGRPPGSKNKTTNSTPCPFLKWAGGKSALVPQLLPLMPPGLDKMAYIEPFTGSGAVFFHLARREPHPPRFTLLDANAELINLFVRVRDNLNELLPLLLAHRQAHNAPGITEEQRKEYYYGVRERQPPPQSLESAARFLYLNKTCFNGLHRVNSKGRFNVPMGSYSEPAIFREAEIRATSALLRAVTIEHADFRSLPARIQGGEFVYLDPPYEPLSATSYFTAYGPENFTQQDQRELRDMLESLGDRCRWMLSNSTAPFIEELYERPGLFKHHVQASRNINSKASARGEIAELVVTNYPIHR